MSSSNLFFCPEWRIGIFVTEPLDIEQIVTLRFLPATRYRVYGLENKTGSKMEEGKILG